MCNSNTQSTFLFYDYESFGLNPSLDRPAQFGAIRTDLNFNIISNPEIFYCKPANDYLPQPNSVLITGITPQEAQIMGSNEAEFALRIHKLFTIPNTCILGYNNIQFDDEITRNIFYRNFYDPYSWNWKNQNSRWDLLNVIRTCYVLRPEGINWPKNINGQPSFRLEDLTYANNIKHNNSHNAIGDILATINIAKLIKNKQPKLFEYLLNYRKKQKLISLIKMSLIKPLIFISSILGHLRNYISIIAPIGWHSHYQNTIIAIDLAIDIKQLFQINNNYQSLIHTFQSSKDIKINTLVKLININKCPILIPVSALRAKDLKRLNINLNYFLKNLNILNKNKQFFSKIENLFSEKKIYSVSNNVDEKLYEGFFNKADRHLLQKILKIDPINIPYIKINSTDSRIKKLIFNYRARNFPNTLNKIDQKLWFQHCQNIFTSEFLLSYIKEIKILKEKYKMNDKKQATLQLIWEYAQKILLKNVLQNIKK